MTAAATWQAADRFRLTGQARYEGARFDDDQNTRRINAGASLDVRAEWRMSAAASAYLAVDNLTQSRIETGRSAANIVTYDAPRMVRLGLTLRR